MQTLWRLHIRPGGRHDGAFSTDFCLANHIVGMGWPIPKGPRRSKDFEWYKEAAAEDYPPPDYSWHSVWTFVETASVGDLVWFRHPDGRYFVAELKGEWEYRWDGDHVPADICNFRPARIVEAGLADSVPGKVVSCFIRGKTFQPIRALGMLAFAGEIVGKPAEETLSGDLFDYLGASDLEDLVAVYLQTQGWYILPCTRTPNTPRYEFVLVHNKTGQRGIVQVKSGNTAILATSYGGDLPTFLFAACGEYGDHLPKNVSVIARSDLVAFMSGKQQFLPDAAKRWIALVGRKNSAP
jgi:hypothetical protein